MWQATRCPFPLSTSSGRSALGEPVGVRLEAAARVERAALRHVDQAGRGARDRQQPVAAVPVEARHRAQQSPGVGVLGLVEDLLRGAVLDRATGVHHQDVVGELGDHPEVVGDDDDRGVELPLEVADQVEDLRLHRHVERRRGLVGDQQVRVARQRHGDHRALSHAAGVLVRVGVHAAVRLRDADPVEHLDGVGSRLLVRHVVVDLVGLDDLVAHRVVRVHRGQRVLEDHRHPLAAHPAHLLGGGRDQVLAVEEDLAADLGAVPLVQAHDGHARHALARAGLAHDAERLATVDGEGQPVDGLHQAVVGREVHAQVADLEERSARRGGGGTFVSR